MLTNNQNFTRSNISNIERFSKDFTFYISPVLIVLSALFNGCTAIQLLKKPMCKIRNGAIRVTMMICVCDMLILMTTYFFYYALLIDPNFLRPRLVFFCKAFRMFPHYLATSREWLVVILAIERAVFNYNYRHGVHYFTTLRLNIGISLLLCVLGAARTNYLWATGVVRITLPGTFPIVYSCTVLYEYREIYRITRVIDVFVDFVFPVSTILICAFIVSWRKIFHDFQVASSNGLSNAENNISLVSPVSTSNALNRRVEIIFLVHVILTILFSTPRGILQTCEVFNPRILETTQATTLMFISTVLLPLKITLSGMLAFCNLIFVPFVKRDNRSLWPHIESKSRASDVGAELLCKEADKGLTQRKSTEAADAEIILHDLVNC